METVRKEFERITQSQYEGDFATYESGDYINEVQQYQWEGFHDGWKAAHKNEDFLVTALNLTGDKLVETVVALKHILNGEVMRGKRNWTHAEVIQEHYKIAREAVNKALGNNQPR